MAHATETNGPTAFTITVKSDVAVGYLQDGDPVTDTVSAGQYRYYAFSVTNPSLDVLIDLTPLTGDADMFVSCYKDLTGDDSGTPSRHNSTWNSQLWGEDTLAILHTDARSCVRSGNNGGMGGGTFYIAVYGFADARFSITAAVDDGLPTRLIVGQPQSGSVLRGAVQLYYVNKVANSDNITITLSPSFGDPDMYVTLDGMTPNASYFAYKATGASGVDAITITPSGAGCAAGRTPSQCYCAHCNINIAVVSFSARSSYTIIVSTGETTTVLQDGVPFRASVTLYTYSYFKFYVPDPGSSVRVAVTAMSGDPDLTVAMTPNPTLGNGTWVSLGMGDDIIIAHNVSGVMYIGVFGFTNSSFSVVAHVTSGNSTTQLVNGRPQFGTVKATDYQYFAYSNDALGNLTFTVTPLTGVVGLFVNTCVNMSLTQCNVRRPTATSYQWSANASLTGETIRISKLDPKACAGCVYVVGVLGVADSNFTLIGSTDASSAAIALQEFIPYRASSNQWQYTYFVFTFYEPHRDLIIAVTPITGDPDLYVSACYEAGNDTCNYQPNNRTAQWRHTALGADTLVVPFGSPGACVPQPPNPCSYYIGVMGFTATTYSVLAYLHSDLPVTLVDGRPQNGIVNASSYDQYMMIVPPGSTSLDITLIPRTGDSDLFVRIDNQKPLQDFWQYRAISAFGNDNIEISATDPLFQQYCVPDGCILRIAVLGFQTSQYTLVATSSGVSTNLVPGVPVRDAVMKGFYDYYTFFVESVAPIAFVVTPLSGDPDLFVGWGDAYAQPNATHYQWSSQRVGVDSVTINPTDANYCQPSSGQCVYHVGVYGYSQNTTFVLTAYLLSTTPVELVDGQPQNGQVETSLTQQYVFYARPGFGQVDITLSPVFGDPDLFVSVNSTSPPSPSQSDFSSMSVAGPEQVTIMETDPLIVARCAGYGTSSCPILIAVNGFVNSSYSLMAVTSAYSSDLSNGVPMYGTVAKNEFQYYVFHADEPNALLQFALTPYSGDPDIYISTTNPNPTTRNFTWASMGIGRDVIEISVEDHHYCQPPCNYYIGVTSYGENASYTITASQGEYTVTQLVDGEPQMGYLGAGSTDQFFYYAPVGTQVITVTLSSLFGDADLYVKLNDTEPPGPNNWDYFSMFSDGDDIITISMSDYQYQRSECNPARANGAAFCVVRLAVSGFTDLTIYSIVASSANAILLLDGVSQSGSVNASRYQQYIFENRYSAAEVDFVLTPIAGDPDMYISTTPNANTTNNYWRGNGMGVDVVQIFAGDRFACATPCRYYIGITGFANAAVYTITARTSFSSPSLLVNGRPQTDFVNASMTKLYFFDASAAAPSFSIRVAAVYGDPDIYVRLDDVPPNQRNAQFKSLSNNADDTLTISTSDPLFQNCTANAQGNNGGASCRVFIAINGFTASQYQITAVNMDSTQQLQEGVPASGQVNNTQYAFYKFIAATAQPYTFSLTPISGDPDMYISWRNNTPTLYNNTWFSNGLGVESVRIDIANDDKAAGCGIPCTFYIGVTGFLRPSAYQIMVSSSYTLLLDGVPQQGHVPPKTMTYYRYRVDAFAGDVSVLVTNIQGSVEVYVSNGGDGVQPTATCGDNGNRPCAVSNYNWTTLSSFDQTSINIRANDTKACLSCYYVIGVLSNSATASADFSLVAASGNAVIQLSDGVPHADTVAQGQYQYYRVTVTQHAVDVEIITSPFYGDPDLFVSWHSSNPRPNATSHDASATSQYNDTIYLQALDLLPCFAASSDGTCNLYVSVLGFTQSSYSIVSRIMNGYLSPIVLVNGIPQSAIVGENEWAYFSAYINLGPGASYSFSLTPTYGDPDMFVTTDESEPSQDNFNYSSVTMGYDSVVIAPGSAGYCTRCTILIGVFGFMSSQFSVLFTSNTSSAVVPLRDGVPEYAQLQSGTFRYYKVYAAAGVAEFDLSVSPLSGNPVTYITIDNTAPGQPIVLPDAQNAIWSSVSQGSQVTVVSAATDSRFRTPATYLVGVYSATPSQFFITSSMSQTSMTALHDGQTILSSVDAAAYTYFVFTTGSMPPSDITVRVSNPSITLYAVNNYDASDPSTLPSQTHYTWTSATDVTNQNILVIPSSSVTNQYYTIAAYSPVATSFSISAASAERVVTLIPGAPSSRFSVFQNVTRHFIVNVYDLTKDLVVSVVALSGDPDMYMSRQHPNPGCIFPPGVVPSQYFPNNQCFNYTWSAISDASTDVLRVRASAPCTAPPATSSCNAAVDWQTGQFYIGVFAYTDTVFDITVTLAGGATSLIPGQTQNAVTSRSLSQVFVLNLQALMSRPSIRFDISAFDTPQPPNSGSPSPKGVNVFVYACRIGQCAAADQQPSSSHFTWAQFISVESSPQMLFIASTDPHYCSGGCNYYIGVFPDSRCPAGSSCDMDFSVSGGAA